MLSFVLPSVHIPKELPEDLKHLLCRMLHKSPDARITMPELRVGHPLSPIRWSLM